MRRRGTRQQALPAARLDRAERLQRRVVSAGGSGGGATFANPTASITTSVTNGSALTAMRSDAAPPLDQAIAPTWTQLHKFTNTIEVGGATLGLGLPGDIQGTNTSGSLIFNSDTTSFPSVPRSSYQFLGYADTFAKFLNRNTLAAILEFKNDGNIIKQNDPADRFLHEKMTLPVLTGTWTFSGTAKGTNVIHVGSTSPSGGERLWLNTVSQQLVGDINGTGTWQEIHAF